MLSAISIRYAYKTNNSQQNGNKSVRRTSPLSPFSFLVQCIFISFPVVLFITGEAPPAALPADAGRAALPLQALLHGEHHRRRLQESHAHATAFPQPQVRVGDGDGGGRAGERGSKVKGVPSLEL